MRSVLTVFATLALACGGGQPKSAEKPDDLKVDVKSPWVDPADDLVGSPVAGSKGDATVNPAAKTVVVTGGTVMTAAGKRFSPGTVILRGGKIDYVGPVPQSLPTGAEVIQADKRFVTPGIIDLHSHIGVYSSPHVRAHSDGNEATAPSTAGVRALYGYNPQDPAITRARAGGVTSALILPGSANLVGGFGQAVIMKPGRHAREVVFPGAPPAIKMACGENPKRVYGEKGGPSTRMGEYTKFRSLFAEAAEYNAKWVKYRRERALWQKKRARAAELEKKAAAKTKGKGKGKAKKTEGESAPEPPSRNPNHENLAAVLRGEVMVQIHCYKAAEIAEMVAISREFGFPIRTFHHALSAYKVRDILVENNIAIATWSDWWGFKMEAFDGIPENAALMTESGGRAIIHSDSASEIQHLNQEAAKAMYSGRAAGVELTEDQALRWITANPAWAMGVDKAVGTLEKGKRADVVVWDGHPFSVYTRADVVVQAGEVTYRRNKGIEPTDFELDNWGMAPTSLAPAVRRPTR